MNPGALNPLHWDNYVEDGEEDISALLYLNEDFEGGELFFPNQNIRIKPESGMLVFFNGTEDYHHTVEVVTKGRREALVGFYWPKDKRINVERQKML
jgi:predicted 2-oxoglutarate/Fe(II)-dependent dioxygenase YbiX